MDPHCDSQFPYDNTTVVTKSRRTRWLFPFRLNSHFPMCLRILNWNGLNCENTQGTKKKNVLIEIQTLFYNIIVIWWRLALIVGHTYVFSSHRMPNANPCKLHGLQNYYLEVFNIDNKASQRIYIFDVREWWISQYFVYFRFSFRQRTNSKWTTTMCGYTL